MKLILTAIMASMLIACTPSQHANPGRSIDILDQNGNSNPQGGVDVGPNKPKNNRFLVLKLSLQPIPGTQLFISVPLGWKKIELVDGLEIANSDGSKLTITKANIDGVATPTLATLKEFLTTRYPARKYSEIQINGSEGFTSNVSNSEGQIETDLYLISEFNDFIHVRMYQKLKSTALVSGQSILESIQTKQTGETKPLSVTRHVTLPAGIFSNEVPLVFAQNNETSLSLVNSKSSSSYIVEIDSCLGDIEFSSVKSIEKNIVLCDNKTISVDKIETIFQSNDRTLKKNNVQLKVGGVYLVRAENGIFTDSLTKVLIESLEPGKLVTLKYQTLMSIPIGTLTQKPKWPKN